MWQIKEGQIRGGTSTLVKNENVNSMGENAFTKKKVEVQTLDAYAMERNLNRIDFIKLDVEGYELECLKGAHSTIDKFSPTILFEHDPKRLSNIGKDEVEFFEILK